MWCRYFKKTKKSSSKICSLSDTTIILCSVNYESCSIIWMLKRLLFWRFFYHFCVAIPILFYSFLAFVFPFTRTSSIFLYNLLTWLQVRSLTQSWASCNANGISILSAIWLESRNAASVWLWIYLEPTRGYLPHMEYQQA